MNIAKKVLMVISLLSMSMITVACSSTQQEDNNDIKSIKVSQINEEIDKGTQVIDIREEYQYIGWDNKEGAGGHIDGSIDFPASWLDIESNFSKINIELKRREIDKSKKTVIYSNNEVDKEIYNKFKELGFTDLSILTGGFNEYVSEKLPVEKMKNYETLVHPQWVYDLVEGKNPDTFKGGEFKVVEIDFGKDKGDYNKGHIPSAITIDDSLNHIEGERILPNYDKMSDEKKFSYWNRPKDKWIKQKLEEMGITKDTTVVVYGSNTTAAARLGVVMKYAGVKDVRLLNGGKKLINSMNMPLESGVNEYKSVKDFGSDVPQNPGILIDYEEELKMVNDTKDSVIASVRSFEEYKCIKSGYTYIKDAGEIKNARFAYAGSDPYNMEDYRNIDDTMFNYNFIKQRWDKWGITSDKNISFHCGTGWRASETYFYALSMGYKDICVYDGGWYEWHLKEDSPKKEEGLPEDAPESEPNSFF
ncbi:sulfurtransferase [Terrisporobacter glycolicus]|uniref:thiosulfate sulfurtransferase n=1 Tax=Terrisporobacter glycolicus ATCC 14880 = DSM 1288 TaxID=1121315 RepID=A0ABZ2EUE7_9FIRM|nr:rhodanese-like domain-containing protein [Terrisporobacter glycolicus]